MKLVSAHVTNYRSVLDSGEFGVAGTTCLVGKNESGKTTILQALERLNPVDQAKKKFNRDLEYPRGYLAEYDDRHDSEAAEIINTKWELDDSDVAAVEGELGAGALKLRVVEVSKAYESEGLKWTISLNEPAIVSHLLSMHGVKAADRLLGSL